MSAELTGQRLFIPTARDCDCTTAHLGGELDAEVPQTSNAQHRNRVASANAAVSQCVECCNSRTQQWRGFFRLELVWNTGQRLEGHYHVVRISAVVAEATDFPIG